jgi:glycolate oxidase
MEILDVVVPRSEVARFVRRVKEISEEHGVPVIVYGHAGDGNVHLHPVCRNMSRKEWDRRLPYLMSDIYAAGNSFAGAISGEHGIGLSKKAYFCSETDSTLLGIMKSIKNAFDPNNILNPGKIFDI